MIVHNEGVPQSPNGGGSGWSADGDLTTVLSQDYSEIFLKARIKYQTDYKRYWPINGSSAVKTLRFMHWDRGTPLYALFTNTGPAFLNTISQNAYGASMTSDSARCDPQQQDSVNYEGVSYRLPYRAAPFYLTGGSPPPAAPWVTTTYDASYSIWNDQTQYHTTNYWCDQNGSFVTKSYFTDPSPECTAITGWNASSTATTGEALGIWDGNWHTITMHAKLNSGNGVNDGIYEVVYDGCQIKYLNNMAWVGVGGDMNNSGWNTITLGGNAFNAFYDQDSAAKTYATGAEQWYAIDDVVVSTTAIPENYVIGGADATPPSAPSGLSVL